MRRRQLLVGAGMALAATPFAARAQQQGRVYRLAFLGRRPPGHEVWQEVLAGLRELGYAEGQNIAVEYFFAPTIAELPQFAAKAVASNPDVIVAETTPAPLAAKALTSTIPIVMTGSGNPVAVGLVASLAKPGGNVTGVSSATPAPKELEFLNELVPAMSRLAVFVQPEDSVGAVQLADLQRASSIFGVKILVAEARSEADIAPGFAYAAANGAQAVLFVAAAFFASFADQIAALGIRYRLPTMSNQRAMALAGGLASYGSGQRARRAAYFIDRILKGDKPADLPVEQPTKYDLVINLKTARALGLDVPFLVLARADEVIE
jgi:putative tryptophan/tyrosine transport system substrate-binding protein